MRSLYHIHEGITHNISDEKPIGWWNNLIHSFPIYGYDVHTASMTCSTDIYIWQAFLRSMFDTVLLLYQCFPHIFQWFSVMQASLRSMFDTVVNETYIHNQDKINPELSDLCTSDLSMLMAGLRNPLADMRNPWALSSKYWWGDNSSHIPNFRIFSALTFIFMFATCSWLVL